MSSNSSKKRIDNSGREISLIEQSRDKEQRESSTFDNCLLAKVCARTPDTRLLDDVSKCSIIALSLLLIALLFDFYIFKIVGMGLGDRALITIAAMSAVFTFLSVRESVKDRETSVAPKLFLGVRDGEEFGVLNVGEGVAHHLEVECYKYDAGEEDRGRNTGDDAETDGGEDEYNDLPDNAVLPVGEFLGFGVSNDDIEREACYEVTMEYRGNLGTVRGPITMVVDGNDIEKELDDG